MPVSTTAADILVRPACARDVPAVVRLVEQSMAADFRGIVPAAVVAGRVAQLARGLKSTWPQALVAEWGGAVAGVALLRDTSHLSLLWTARGVRGQGLGGALMDATEARVFGQGCAAMSLFVYRDNPRAVAFYRRRGWTEVSRHVGEVGAVLIKMSKLNLRMGRPPRIGVQPSGMAG